jgi:hypothetical protein
MAKVLGLVVELDAVIRLKLDHRSTTDAQVVHRRAQSGVSRIVAYWRRFEVALELFDG